MSDASSFSELAIQFAELSKRLGEIDVAVLKLTLFPGWFRCWEMIVTKENEAIRFFYDGRDHYIQTEKSRIRKLSFPNEWQKIDAKAFETGSEAVSYAEHFLKEKFGKISD
jgi:hypothetical protein